MDRRIPPERERRKSKARFRCKPCARFVVATEYGVCPHCGLGPPSVILSRPQRARAAGIGTGYWILVAVFAIAIGVAGAVLAVW